MKIRKENDLRKIIVLLLTAAVLVVGMLPGTVLATGSTDIASGTDWVLSADGKLTISSNAGMTDWIGNGETYKEDVISVEISNGVTNIGRNAFYKCSNLASVSIPESVANIENWAFRSCGSLTGITIPGNVTSIGSAAFYDCKSLKSVTISEGVTSIGDSAFSNCESLTGITIPGSVTSIGAYAFLGCSSLEEVAVAEDNSKYKSIDGVLYDKEGKKLLYVPEVKQGAFRIPDGVTDIENSAFSDCESLTGVTIPEGVTRIGAGAFSGCTSLENVTIPGSVTSIGNGAFSDCTSLKSVTIPVGVTTIGNRMFYSCTSLESVTISGSVTSIGEHAFYDCESLTSIGIPGSVTSIGKYAFYDCKSLKSVTIPEDVATIATYTFCGCTSLESVTISEGVTTIGINAFHSCKSLKSVTIPGSVTSIEEAAFAFCGNLTGVEISEGVRKIGPSVFANCSSLKSVTIPESVTNIGQGAFNMCYDLKSVTILANVGSISWYMFSSCSSLTSVTIPESVTDIGRGAFKYCSSLTEVTMLSETPPTIEADVFYDCAFVINEKKGIHVPVGKAETYKAAWTYWADYIGADIASGTGWRLNVDGGLTISSDEGMTDWMNNCAGYKESVTNVKISDGVTNIGASAFSGCTNLTKVTIPAGVTSIGETTFRDCSALISITIPKDVTMIGNDAFNGCTNLAEVIVLNETPPAGTGDGTFTGCKFVTDNKKGIHVPAGKADTYKEAWTDWADYIVADIASGTDWKIDADGKLTISSDAGMTDWIAKKNDYKDSVKSVNISDGVTNIGDDAFSNCRNLTSVTIPDSVTHIGEDAFGLCSSLTGIEIPDSVTDIGEYAFRGCGFTTIAIPSGVTSIQGCTFLCCSNLTSVSIPDSVTSIGEHAFDRCIGLKKITIPEQVTEIGENAFIGCENLTEVTIPEGVTSIGGGAFLGCSALTSITIPEGVAEIGIRAFRDCTSLAEVIMLGATPPAIGETGEVDDTFTGCKFVTDNKKGIRVPAGKADAYKGAWTNWADYITDDAKIAAEAKTAAADKLKTVTVTNATTKEEILSAVNEALKSAGISGVTVTVEDFTKTEATTSAEGSIRGTVKITCGNQTETITIDQVIAKLPDTGNEEAKKVAEAKTAAEGALQTIKLTNATTKEEIQSAVNAALNSAGITDVTVTVEDFTKTEATTLATGSIRATVKITCGDQTETITINQTIAKLSETGGTGSMTEEEKASVGKLVKELGVSEETAAKILAAAKELDVPMETLLIGEDTLANHKSEGDIKGSTFQKLQAAASKTTSKSVKLTWNKVKGADGYQIYGAKCGKANKLKLLKDTQKGSTKTYTQKKLKKGTAYKYVVRAYKVIDGKRITIAASKCVHVYTDGGKYGNTKSVKVKKIKKSKVTLKKGKTYKLRASEVKAKKPLKRHRKLGYESSNEKVATVTSKGVIRAKAKGTCTVYVYAQNGKQKKIKVTVK